MLLLLFQNRSKWTPSIDAVHNFGGKHQQKHSTQLIIWFLKTHVELLKVRCGIAIFLVSYLFEMNFRDKSHDILNELRTA